MHGFIRTSNALLYTELLTDSHLTFEPGAGIDSLPALDTFGSVHSLFGSIDPTPADALSP
jgi:hypothetical protein